MFEHSDRVRRPAADRFEKRRRRPNLPQPTGLNPVVKKAADKSTKKKRRARTRKYSDEERAAGFDFPDLKVLAPEQSKQPRDATPKKKWIDPPSWWSKERLREVYEEQKRRETEEQHPVSLSRAAKKVMGRAVMGVVTMESAPAKSAPVKSAADPVREAILQFVAKQWPGVAPETITPKTFIAVARKDPQFLRQIE